VPPGAALKIFEMARSKVKRGVSIYKGVLFHCTTQSTVLKLKVYRPTIFWIFWTKWWLIFVIWALYNQCNCSVTLWQWLCVR